MSEEKHSRDEHQSQPGRVREEGEAYSIKRPAAQDRTYEPPLKIAGTLDDVLRASVKEADEADED